MSEHNDEPDLSEYGTGSLSYRDFCLQEKGEQCQLCESEENIVVHHIDGNRDNNSLDNLMPVCNSCHNRIHTGAEGFEEYYEKLPKESQRGPGDTRFDAYHRVETTVFETGVRAGGAISIPYEFRKRYGIEPGDRVLIDVIRNDLHDLSAIKEMQQS